MAGIGPENPLDDHVIESATYAKAVEALPQSEQMEYLLAMDAAIKDAVAKRAFTEGLTKVWEIGKTILAKGATGGI